MHWCYLLLAIVFEVSGTTSMKLSRGFTEFAPSVVMAICYCLSLGMLTMALNRIDIGVAYAIWSGLGTALIAMLGIAWFQEPGSLFKYFCLGLIILGVIGLNLQPGGH